MGDWVLSFSLSFSEGGKGGKYWFELLDFSVAGEDADFISHIKQRSFGNFVGVFFEFELVFDEGKSLGVVGLHFGEEGKDDREESEVDLGRVNAAVRHGLCHALFPIVAFWVLEGDFLSDSWRSGNSIASFSFVLRVVVLPEHGEGGDSGFERGGES